MATYQDKMYFNDFSIQFHSLLAEKDTTNKSASKCPAREGKGEKPARNILYI